MSACLRATCVCVRRVRACVRACVCVRRLTARVCGFKFQYSSLVPSPVHTIIGSGWYLKGCPCKK